MAQAEADYKSHLSNLSKIPAKEFEKHFQEWMERDDVARALQAKLRFDLIRSFNKTALGKQILAQTTTTLSGGSVHRLKLSPLVLALNTLVAEFLYAENCHFALSVFCTEVPFRNTLPDFESQRQFRFTEGEIVDILEAISISLKDAGPLKADITRSYIGSSSASLLLLLLQALLQQFDKPALKTKFRDVGTIVEQTYFPPPQMHARNRASPRGSPTGSAWQHDDVEAAVNKSNLRHLNKYIIVLSKKVKEMAQQFENLQQAENLPGTGVPLRAEPAPRFVQSVRTRRYEKLNRSLDRITKSLRKMSKAKQCNKHVGVIVNAIEALATQFTQCAANFDSVSRQLVETRKQELDESTRAHTSMQAVAEEREVREKSYTDWVHEMRHTKNGQKFLDRVELSLRKALNKQKELLRNEAEVKMQHQRELLKIRYKHKLMQELSKHPASDICGEARKLNASIEHQLREFEARHVDLLQKIRRVDTEDTADFRAEIKSSPLSLLSHGCVSIAKEMPKSIVAEQTASEPQPSEQNKTAADKFVAVVREKMKQQELEKLAREVPYINPDSGPVLRVEESEFKIPSQSSSCSQTIKMKMNMPKTGERVPPPPPSTPIKPRDPLLKDAVIAQKQLHKMVRNIAAQERNVDHIVYDAKLRIKELENESNQLEQNFKHYLERQRLQTTTMHDVVASIRNDYQTEHKLNQKSYKIMRKIRALPKSIVEDDSNDYSTSTVIESTPEKSVDFEEEVTIINDRQQEPPPEPYTRVQIGPKVVMEKNSPVVLEFRNAILEAKEKLFKRDRDGKQHPNNIPALTLRSIPSRTETECDLNQCLSAVQAFYYNTNFGKIQSQSNFSRMQSLSNVPTSSTQTTDEVTLTQSTSAFSLVSSAIQLAPDKQPQPIENNCNDSTRSKSTASIESNYSSEQTEPEDSARSSRHQSPLQVKRKVVLSEKPSKSSLAVTCAMPSVATSTVSTIQVACATAVNAKQLQSAANTQKEMRNRIGTCRGDVLVGASVAAVSDDNKNVNNVRKARRKQSHGGNSNSDNNNNSTANISNKKSHKEKLQTDKLNSNSSAQQRQQAQMPVAATEQNVEAVQSTTSVMPSATVSTSTTSLMSTTSLVLQQSMARMYQLFAEAPLAVEQEQQQTFELEEGEVYEPDMETAPEQWQQNVNQQQNAANNNETFVARNAGGHVAAVSDDESEIAASSYNVNNNKNGNIARKSTIAREQQKQRQQKDRDTTSKQNTAMAQPRTAASIVIRQEQAIGNNANNILEYVQRTDAANVSINKTQGGATATTIATTTTTTTTSTTTQSSSMEMYTQLAAAESATMLPINISSTTFSVNLEDLSSPSQSSLEMAEPPQNEPFPPVPGVEEMDDEGDEELEPMGGNDRVESGRNEAEAVVPTQSSSSSSIELQLSTGGGRGRGVVENSDSGSDFWQ